MGDREKRKIMGVRFPNLYLWLVFLSALDVVLTRVILYFGGTEVNPVADWVIVQWGQMGLSLFKFASTRRGWTIEWHFVWRSLAVSFQPYRSSGQAP